LCKWLRLSLISGTIVDNEINSYFIFANIPGDTGVRAVKLITPPRNPSQIAEAARGPGRLKDMDVSFPAIRKLGADPVNRDIFN